MRTLKDILGNEDLVTFLTKAKINFQFFAERVLNLEIEPFHLEWVELVEKNDRVAILAPTGFGKTTILGIAYPLWKSFFSHHMQFLIVSKTMSQSGRILELIKNSIEDNELLVNLRPKDASLSWSKQVIVTSTQCKIMCRPYSVNIKGEHVNYILCDEASSYMNQSIFFDYVVTRAAAKNGKVVAISTPENPVDLMATLARTPGYLFKKYIAIDSDGNLLYPKRFNKEKLEKLKKELGESYYQKNYLCNSKTEAENAIFSLKKIMEGFDYERTFSSASEGQVLMACDFAVAKGPKADFDAYVIIERLDNKFIIKYIEIHRGFPFDAKARRIKELSDIYKPMRIIVDESGIGTAMVSDLRGLGLPIVPQSFHSKARNDLINTLKNVIDGGKLIIPRSTDDMLAMRYTDKLIEQLMGFKEQKSQATGNKQYLSVAPHDDIVMAIAMAVKGAVQQRTSCVSGVSAS